MFRVSQIARASALLLGLVAAGVATTAAQAPLNRYGYPEKHTPKPTTAAITAADLMTRLYIFADDSMEGRQVGRVGNMKGTNYIAGELKRLGIAPAGEHGSYFQTLPYIQRKFTEQSTLSVNGTALRFNADFVPVPGARAPSAVLAAQVIYGGVAGDTLKQISAEQAAGKFVILSPAPTSSAAPAGGGRRGGFGGGGGATGRFAGAVAVATIDLDALAPAARAAINNPPATMVRAAPGARPASSDIVVNSNGKVGIVRDGALVSGTLAAGQTAASVQAYADSLARADSIARAARPGNGRIGIGTNTFPNTSVNTVAPIFRITSAAAAMLLGKSVDGIALGATGGNVSASLNYLETPTDYGRNVVAVIPGSDPALRGEYVALGGHNDHIGVRPVAVDHDSARAAMSMRLKMQMATGDLLVLTPEQAASVTVNVDSLRKIRPARPDSINNGADDDGSGSMGVLEIAEAIAKMPVKPKRSILFVWHTGEEAGLVGSSYFAANPTVPLDSIVTQINIDMIGRGRAEDIVGGGDNYVGVLGANRLSGDLGRIMAAVNAKRAKPIGLDSRFDDPTLGTAVDGVVHWPGYNNIYGRSDHANYSNKCIPIVFFFTGLHGDYHQVTDEPQYIDYPHYATITNFIKDLAIAVGNAPVRPALDQACVRR
ncbi:MAG: M28 family peptidase [Gemmatimonadota bacterium]